MECSGAAAAGGVDLGDGVEGAVEPWKVNELRDDGVNAAAEARDERTNAEQRFMFKMCRSAMR